MKKNFIILFIAIVLVSCNSSRIKELEKRNKELQDSVQIYKQKSIESDSIESYCYNLYKTENDSILALYEDLKEKMTRHVKYVYTVQDDYVLDEGGHQYSLEDFIYDLYMNGKLVDYVHVNDAASYLNDEYEGIELLELIDRRKISKSEIIEYFDITSQDINSD